MDKFSLLAKEIKSLLPELDLREREPMSTHCSFQIGGEAALMALPSSIEETEALCAFLRERGVKPLVIGNGTNLLVTDAPLRRFVLKLSKGVSEIQRLDETRVFAQAGVSLARLANTCAHFSLTGLEFAQGIPGTLGGAVYMNAGAYGGEMKDVVSSVRYLDEEMQLCEKAGADLDFSYRHSAFSDGNNILLGCTLTLAPGDEEEILEKIRTLAERRRCSQTLEMPSAGSTFKRPAQGYAAALIEEAGLKGFGLGGAQVSEKHAGFVVNRGGASFDDVLRLIDHIRNAVLEKTGIRLEPEVRLIENQEEGPWNF